MSLPLSRQTQLVKSLLLLEDPQERLAYVLERAHKLPPLPPHLKTDAHRVPGCQTKVWLAPSLSPEGTCLFHVDSESPMVRALAALVCELYSGAFPAEVASFPCALFEHAKLSRMITPTRLRGLASLEETIRSFAAAHTNPNP